MPIPLPTDFDANTVRLAARKSKDGANARRLLALAHRKCSRDHVAHMSGLNISRQAKFAWLHEISADLTPAAGVRPG